MSPEMEFFITQVWNFYRGTGPASHTHDYGEKLTELKHALVELEEHEKILDLHTKWIKQSFKNVESECTSKPYTYVTYEDMKEIFDDEFVMGITAPSNANIIVPNLEVKYQWNTFSAVEGQFCNLFLTFF